jgi:hypothetical protein
VNRIDVLPDDVLLEIFDFYVKMDSRFNLKASTEKWQLLVHVCRRWRSVVLGSPHILNLRLYCTPKTPVGDTLDVWPAFPLIVEGITATSRGTGNIIAALGQGTRVCQVNLGLTDLQSEQVLAAMEVPFPELTDLRLFSYDTTLPVIPASFLDGSAPRLRSFYLNGIPFPELPKLHLLATHLVHLELYDIPHSGYISPEAIVAPLSALSSLESLTLEFQSPQSCPDRATRRPPPSKRSVVPALHHFRFKGVTEYLEDLVTWIDTPQLDSLEIRFFNQIDFDIPRLAQFINRTPKLGKRRATVLFDGDFAHVRLSPGILEIAISCVELDWQLSSIEQVCNSSLHPLSTVEDPEDPLWLQLFLPFTAVKNLYLSERFAPAIAATLQEFVGGRITEVLPSLEHIFVEGLEPSGPVQKDIGQFAAARQLSDHPIAISVWDEDFNVMPM